MQLSIVSWNSSTDINNNSDFAAWFETGQNFVQREANYVERSQTWQKLAGAQFTDSVFVFKIRCLGTIHSQRETIKKYFSLEDFNKRRLVVKDTADSNREWYVEGMTTKVFEETPGVMAVSISLDEPFWRTVAESTGSLAISSTPTSSTDYIALGNMSAKPVFTITPNTAKAGDYAYKRWVTVYNQIDNAFPNYPLDFGGLDTAALVLAGKMQATGADYRLRINGPEADRWFDSTGTRGINTTDTACWGVVDLSPKTEFTLGTAIGSTDTVTTISGADTAATLQAMLKLRTVPNKTVLIGAEAFNYTGVTSTQLTGVTRAMKGTSAAAYTTTDTVRHMEIDPWLLYGSTNATAPVVDDTKKPMIDLQSSNTSWIWYSFYDSTSPRPGAWIPDVINAGTGKLCTYYTATENTNANPATDMGTKLTSWYLYAWRIDSGDIVWSLTHPAGIQTIQAPGKKYRYSTTYPTTAALQYLEINRLWTTADNQSTPSAALTWEAFTIESTGTGNLTSARNNLRFRLSGSVLGVASNYVAYEIGTVTGAIPSANAPYVSIGAEQSTYRLDCRITNTTTGEWIEVDADVGISRVLTIDCDAKTCTLDDGTNMLSTLTFSTSRDDWLNFQNGANIITYTETGVASVTLGTEWENRNTL